MWKYSKQIQIRWISFILGIVILCLILIFFRNLIPNSQIGMKIFLAQLQVSFENLPIWYYVLFIILIVGLMLLGVPSIIALIPLILVKNCTFAYMVTCLCQITSTLIAMWISYNFSHPTIQQNLKEKLESNKDSFQSFAFWSRLYYNIPLRTIDRLTPIVHNSKETFFASLIAASSAIMIRICIPAMLLKHIIDQFTLLESNPELEYTKFIIWAIILIIYTILPKVPELIICPKKVKKVIYEIESPTENRELKTEN